MAKKIEESVLCGIDAETAKRMNEEVNSKRATWCGIAQKYGVSGSYVRRYCRKKIGEAFESASQPLSWMTLEEARSVLKSIMEKQSTWVSEANRRWVSGNGLKKRVFSLILR